MIAGPSPEIIEQAVNLLRQGDLLAFPTETVYGLGADASNPEAVSKIFVAKGRPKNHPVIVHLADSVFLEQWAKAIPDEAFVLAEAFWPGPLTLILKRSSLVPDIVTGGQDSVGLRVPQHPVALQLLSAFAAGVAAPSANRFGRISPTSAEHVQAELGEHVKLILDGGPSAVGLESTILDLSRARARVLRPGGISIEELKRVLGYEPAFTHNPEIRVSGSLASHYAPTTASFLVKQVPDDWQGSGVISRKPAPFASAQWLTLAKDAKSYAQELYAALRELDRQGLASIFIEDVPHTSDWLAVRDRLLRASFQKTP